MSSNPFGILRFHEQYFERIWGGQRLQTLFNKPIPNGKSIGEAWLISDHPSAVSVVREGPHAGRTLHDLIELDADALLGSHKKRTPHGRFPLLLKLLDSTDVLSVQVHPDDETAAA
ncbi:MAG: mannose-6-phosphate isomerase, partial [Candidatus Hydrogenedentes bacterium]|nr:mannose-6-phosphate isomerase [Candidatus Hydrogenedentota bacterium]